MHQIFVLLVVTVIPISTAFAQTKPNTFDPLSIVQIVQEASAKAQARQWPEAAALCQRDTSTSHPMLVALIANKTINQRGKLFVIIGRRTYSAAQNTATYFERYTNATFIGEPTGSSPNFVGEESPVTLPYSKVMANVSHLFWQSAYPQDRRMWIAPSIYVPPTFADFRIGRDAALEAVLNYPSPH